MEWGAKLGSAQAVSEAKFRCLALRTDRKPGKKAHCLEETQTRRPTSESLQECRRKKPEQTGDTEKW